jgi:hypothetical protein
LGRWLLTKCEQVQPTHCLFPGLLRGSAFFLDWQHLAPAIRPAVGADMMRETRLMTLRATDQLWNLEMMVTAPFGLGSFGYLSFW